MWLQTFLIAARV